MMVVVTVLAADLHLYLTVTQDKARCQILLRRRRGNQSGRARPEIGVAPLAAFFAVFQRKCEKGGNLHRSFQGYFSF
jgi:hypothetical protein